MNDLITGILFFTVFALLAWGMMRSDRIYQFPFQVGAVTFAFILVQVPGLAHERFLPDSAFVKTIAFLIACLVMSWAGWASSGKPLTLFRLSFDERRLLIAAACLSIVGAYFYYALSRVPPELTIAVQMTGVPVIYVFFSRLLVYGLAVSTLCLAHRFSIAALGIVGFDLLFIFDRIIRSGSRADTTELIMIFALAWWFQRRRVIPRWLALGGLVIGTLLMNSVGDYRAVAKSDTSSTWTDIAEIDVVGNTTKVWNGGGEELRNAIYRLSYTDQVKQFDYGLSHWNNIVFAFVPAQLVGSDLKSRLMVKLPPQARNYNPSLGTTETGLADAFQSFWYFGAMKFFLLAYVMRRILASAERGEFAAQFVYVLSVVPAMHSITHKTDWVLMIWVHMLLFAAPVLWLATASTRERYGRLHLGPAAGYAGG
jgi:hypothetical protein